MNKEMITIISTGLGVTVTLLIAIWMTWADTNQRLVSVETRLARVEGLLIARGEMPPPVSENAG
ncbi:MAG: hypothetical protein F4X06_12675 [Gammaproteobacteria bacterium]|nr:hypothetical protein [Gammaproteobacteria bacterium]